MKAFLNLEDRNLSIFFELEDFQALINEEVLETYLYLVTEDPRFIDRTKLTFATDTYLEILKKDIGLRNIFRNMIEYEQFQLLFEIKPCKNNCTYDITMTVDSFDYCLERLKEYNNPIPVLYLTEACIEFYSEINNPEKLVEFTKLEKKWQIRFAT